MKRVLFLLVSALLAGTTYASNLSKDVIAKVTNANEFSITEQGQSLILEQPVSAQLHANQHGSHVSHSSHSSHFSHRSHSSHYSSSF